MSASIDITELIDDLETANTFLKIETDQKEIERLNQEIANKCREIIKAVEQQ